MAAEGPIRIEKMSNDFGYKILPAQLLFVEAIVQSREKRFELRRIVRFSPTSGPIRDSQLLSEPL